MIRNLATIAATLGITVSAAAARAQSAGGGYADDGSTSVTTTLAPMPAYQLPPIVATAPIPSDPAPAVIRLVSDGAPLVVSLRARSGGESAACMTPCVLSVPPGEHRVRIQTRGRPITLRSRIFAASGDQAFIVRAPQRIGGFVMLVLGAIGVIGGVSAALVGYVDEHPVCASFSLINFYGGTGGGTYSCPGTDATGLIAAGAVVATGGLVTALASVAVLRASRGSVRPAIALTVVPSAGGAIATGAIRF